MKRSVSPKKWCMLAVCIILTCQVFAERTTFKQTTIQEKNDNWSPQKGMANDKRPNGLGDNEPADPNIRPLSSEGPVGDALPFLLGLSLIYGACSIRKKRKTGKR